MDARSFGTGIALRNRHLRSHLDAQRHPRILLRVDRVVPRPERGPREVDLLGELTIRGTTRAVEIPAVVLTGAPLTVEGRLQTRFTDWGMRPPTQMGGLARVADPLLLRFHAVFR